MALDTTISVRLDSEDLPLLQKVMEYRFKQTAPEGMKRMEIGEYIRFLMNCDIREVLEEIKARREV